VDVCDVGREYGVKIFMEIGRWLYCGVRLFWRSLWGQGVVLALFGIFAVVVLGVL
jgi:hypothetical protein